VVCAFFSVAPCQENSVRPPGSPGPPKPPRPPARCGGARGPRYRYHSGVPHRFLYYTNVLVRILREEEYGFYLEALAEALPNEIAATDASGRVIVWNRALAAVAGSREQAVGRPLLDALPWLAEDPNLPWATVIDDVLAGGKGHTFARQPLGKRVVRATIGPMIGAEGRVLGLVLSFDDITHGTREEEQKRARERREAIHDLGASLAHEIRNPLNALSLNLQLLRERLGDPDVARDDIRERTDRMIAESQRLEQLVVHLLEVSRGGALERTREAVDPIVASVLSRLEGMARAHACEVQLSAGSSRSLMLDRGRIDRAIENVVRNAIEAAAEGGHHVWIATRDDPISTVIVIEDDGPGIRAEDRSAVFVLYRTGKRGGTGLGLPLAREEIRRHGGEIEALPRPGGGAQFVIHLPLDAPAHVSHADVREV